MKQYTYHYDVAVIGGGPAGLATAITAAREGKKVLLADKNGFLGGNLTIGLPLLGFLDEHGNQCISGFAEELVQRLQQRNACYGIRPCPKHNSVANVDAEAVKILAFEMCREAGVEILLHVEAIDAAVEQGKLKSVTLYGKCNRIIVSAELFVDCTGDGDVGCLAGCSYEKGRGDQQEMMPPTVMCTIEGVNDKALLDYVAEHPEEMNPMVALKLMQLIQGLTESSTKTAEAMDMLEKGQIKVRTDFSFEEKALVRVTSLTGYLVRALIVIAIFIGSCLLCLAFAFTEKGTAIRFVFLLLGFLGIAVSGFFSTRIYRNKKKGK